MRPCGARACKLPKACPSGPSGCRVQSTKAAPRPPRVRPPASRRVHSRPLIKHPKTNKKQLVFNGFSTVCNVIEGWCRGVVRLSLLPKATSKQAHASGVLGFSLACSLCRCRFVSFRFRTLKDAVRSSHLGFIQRKTDCSAVFTFKV